MNSDITPDRSDTSHPPSARQPLGEHWRAASNAHHALFADSRDEAAVSGEIWSIGDRAATPDQAFLLAVITAVSDEAATVVPLSTELNHATEWDLVIPAQTLGYQTIAQVKLAGTVALGQLDQRLSSLAPGSKQQLQELLAAAATGTPIPPQHLPLGPWVLTESDQRLRARALIGEQLRSYLVPEHANPLSEWHSLGSILTRSSRATGIDLATLVDASVVEKLRSDQLDLFSTLPARKMAQLLSTLRIPWTERVRDALYRVVSARYNPTDFAHGSALGRRRPRRTQRSQRAHVSQQQREQAAGEYIKAVERELGEP